PPPCQSTVLERSGGPRGNDVTGRLFATGHLPLIERQATLEADAPAAAEVHGSLESRGHILPQQSDGPSLPLDGRREVAHLGVSRGEGIQAVGVAPARQVAGSGGFLDGSVAV